MFFIYFKTSMFIYLQCTFNSCLPVSPAGVVNFSNEIFVLWPRRVAPDRESEASCWVRVLIHNWGLFRGLPMPATKLVMGMRHNFEASILSCNIYIYIMTCWCKQTFFPILSNIKACSHLTYILWTCWCSPMCAVIFVHDKRIVGGGANLNVKWLVFINDRCNGLYLLILL